MVRETKVSLPYHKARQTSLAAFLNRKKGMPEIVKSMKLSKLTLEADVLLKEREKKMAEFYKTQTETLKATREAGPSSKFNEDKLVLVEKDIQVRDDGKTVIDIDMRMMAAKFPNSPPDTWWSAQIPQVSKPRLAHSLHFGYITGSHVCRETIYKFHDRGEFLTLKNFSSNNSGVICKVQKKVSLEDGTTGEFSGTSEKDWRDIASLAEAKEAVRNIQVLSMIIRSYDYGKGI